MPPTNVIISTKRIQFFLQDESIVLSDSGIPDVSTLLLEIGSSTSPLQIMSLLKFTLVSIANNRYYKASIMLLIIGSQVLVLCQRKELSSH